MFESFLRINDTLSPQVLAAEKGFVLVFKPPRIHSAPLAKELSPKETILSWCIEQFPEITDLSGRKPGEGGLLHRLDYETQGLMLFARNRDGMEKLLEQQREGKIIKEYSALVAESEATLPGFPVEQQESFTGDSLRQCGENGEPQKIQSAFRPFGPGRKAVRPVITGEQYLTQLLKSSPIAGELTTLRLRIYRGFRHQIRCHLAWMRMPILNDNLYGGLSHGNGFLGLRACLLSFTDPSSGEQRSYSIPPLEPDEI